MSFSRLFLAAATLSAPCVWGATLSIWEEITPVATAAPSVCSPTQQPGHLTDISGLIGELHDNQPGAATMGHTEVNPKPSVAAPGLPAALAWVRFDFRELETRADGSMICRWIMPYQKSGSLRIHNLAKNPVSVKAGFNIAAWAWSKDSLHFHTNWWTDKPRPPRPVWDMNFIEVKGRGIHVGDTLVVLNPLWSWWGEGDEKIYVGEDIERRFPSHFGTGSEDYYGWAGGEVPTRKDEFSAPFLANVRVGGQTRDWPAGQEPYTHGYNICSRSRSLDATPFARHFKFDMEAFNMIGTPDAYLQYALVTHWYGAPGATHNRPPMPEAAVLPVPQTEDVIAFAKSALAGGVQAFHLPDAIEFEDMKRVSLSPGPAGWRPADRQRLAALSMEQRRPILWQSHPDWRCRDVHVWRAIQAAASHRPSHPRKC